MDGKTDIDLLSEHDRYYRRIRNGSYVVILVSIPFSMLICYLLLFFIQPLNEEPSPLPLVYENFEVTIFVFILIGCSISTLLTNENRKKSKSALAGNLISLNEPRWVSIGTGSLNEVGVGCGHILTMAHPNDKQIERRIHLDFSEDLEKDNVLFLFDAECTSRGTRTNHWSMPRETHRGGYGSGGGSYGSGGGSYGYGGDSEYHGSTTYYHAELKLKSSERVFSTTEYNNWIKEGDSVDLVVQIKEITEEKCKLIILKVLNLE